MSMKGNNGPYLVYQGRNLINGKRYIGITAGPLRVRSNKHRTVAYAGKSQTLISKAIRKYGHEMIRFRVLKIVGSYEETNEEEIRLIALLKPEYNLTKGGKGTLGYKMSPEAIERAASKKRGKPGPWTGKTLPQHVKALQKERAERNIDKWTKWRALGPKATRYRIECVTDGKVYNGFSAVAAAYGISKEGIRQVCKGKKSQFCGYIFRIVGEIALLPVVVRPKRDKPVICLDDGLIYSTATAAAEIYGLDASQISGVCLKRPNRLCAGGLVFRFANDAHGGKEEADAIRKMRLESRQRTAAIARKNKEKQSDDV